MGQFQSPFIFCQDVVTGWFSDKQLSWQISCLAMCLITLSKRPTSETQRSTNPLDTSYNVVYEYNAMSLTWEIWHETAEQSYLSTSIGTAGCLLKLKKKRLPFGCPVPKNCTCERIGVLQCLLRNYFTEVYAADECQAIIYTCTQHFLFPNTVMYCYLSIIWHTNIHK